MPKINLKILTLIASCAILATAATAKRVENLYCTGTAGEGIDFITVVLDQREHALIVNGEYHYIANTRKDSRGNIQYTYAYKAPNGEMRYLGLATLNVSKDAGIYLVQYRAHHSYPLEISPLECHRYAGK